MKKNSVLLIVVILLFTLIPVGLSGCLFNGLFVKEKILTPERIFTSGDFDCISEEEGTVTILQLSEEGKKKEIIVIPEEIDGMKVTKLGGRLRKYTVGQYIPYELKSEKVKKIYVKEFDRTEGLYSFMTRNEMDFVLIMESIEAIEKVISAFTANNKVYQNICYYGFIPENEIEIEERYIVKKCNMFFYSDTQEEEMYWIDMIKDGAIYQKPEDPKREGYVFGGWFHEENCLNEWNGEYMLPEEAEELHLYAKWTKLE